MLRFHNTLSVFVSLILLLVIASFLPSRPVAQQLEYQPLQYKIDTNTNTQESTETTSEQGAIVNVATLQSVKVISPNGGESFALDGSDQKITFSANLDPANDGEYTFQLELWRNGKKVGNINQSPQSFSLDNIKTGFGMPQYQVGAYYLGGGAPSNYYVADPGAGYQVKVVAYLNGDVVASDESDADFSYIPGPPRGEPHVILEKPNGQETFVLGKGANVQFSYGGLDPYKRLHEADFELWRNGNRLGNLISLQPISTDAEHVSISVNIDTYQDETYKTVKAEPGDGYKLRVILYDSKDAVSQDDSDYPFSFSSPVASGGNFLSIIFSRIQSFFGNIFKLFK